MHDVRLVSEQELVWNWARAEIESTRHSQYYNLPSEVLERLRNDKKEELSVDEWNLLTEQVLTVRGPLLAGLRRLKTKWHLGFLSYEELRYLKIMGWSGFFSWAESGRFEEFVRAVDLGKPPVTTEW